MILPSCRSLSTMWRFLTTTSPSCTAWWAPGPSHPTQLSGPASSHGSIPSTPTLSTPMFQVFFHIIPWDSVSAMTCRNCFITSRIFQETFARLPALYVRRIYRLFSPYFDLFSDIKSVQYRTGKMLFHFLSNCYDFFHT